MELDDITGTESEIPVTKPPRPSPLPWILLFVTVAVFVGTTLFLWSRASTETARSNQAYVDKTKAEARAGQAEQLLEGQRRDLEAQAAELTRLRADNTRLEGELKAALARAPPEKSRATKKAPVKKPVKRKRR